MEMYRVLELQFVNEKDCIKLCEKFGNFHNERKLLDIVENGIERVCIYLFETKIHEYGGLNLKKTGNI